MKLVPEAAVQLSQTEGEVAVACFYGSGQGKSKVLAEMLGGKSQGGQPAPGIWMTKEPVYVEERDVHLFILEVHSEDNDEEFQLKVLVLVLLVSSCLVMWHS